MADSPSGGPKERHSLTLDQRRALRRWANNQTVRPSHKACIEWFQSQYGQIISQSTVSHSLSPKYARLDAESSLSGSRLRYGNWPDVEKLVLLWHQQVRNSGRSPSNEELADKAKSIFQQLPKYKDQAPPEFSPGWIHRFKKRYNLLTKRRKTGSDVNPGDNVAYLVDAVPRFMAIDQTTSPAVMRDTIQRVVGIEASVATCARVRDEILRQIDAPHEQVPAQHNGSVHHANGDTSMQVYGEEDPEVVLQNALRQLQDDDADADGDSPERSAVHPALAAQSYAQQAAAGALATPVHNSAGANRYASASSARYEAQSGPDLTLTPIPGNGPTSMTDRPVRCPFCVNQRMLRTIKEAVEHLSTHVVV